MREMTLAAYTIIIGAISLIALMFFLMAAEIS